MNQYTSRAARALQFHVMSAAPYTAMETFQHSFMIALDKKTSGAGRLC